MEKLGIYPRLEVIVGSMFSGKSEELIRRTRRELIAKRRVQVFKHAIDVRYDNSSVASHVGSRLDASPVQSVNELEKLIAPDTEVVSIEEVQFFDPQIVELVQRLVDGGKRVILAGLDLDFRGQPWPHMATLLALAERVDKLQAVCVVCGGEASRTQRLIDGQPAPVGAPLISVGAADSYEARCRACFAQPR